MMYAIGAATIPEVHEEGGPSSIDGNIVGLLAIR